MLGEGRPSGLRFERDDFLDNVGRGADNGPGGGLARPTVLMSSGWKSPRRTEFFIYTQYDVRHLGPVVMKSTIP